jgi:hypothetical protein
VLIPAMAVVIALLVVVAALLHAAGRARARALAEDVRTSVEPYLRRKAAEAGLPASAPTWTRRTQPEEIVAYASALSKRLLDQERFGAGPQARVAPLELARTQPVDGDHPTDDLRARRS